MAAVDHVISTYQKSGSISVGIGIGLVSAIGNRVLPKLPRQFFHICDMPVVQVALVTLLLNSQWNNHFLSFLTATFLVYFLKTVINSYVPETPPLSKLIVQKDQGNKGSAATPPSGEQQPKSCTCTCGDKPVPPFSSFQFDATYK